MKNIYLSSLAFAMILFSCQDDDVAIVELDPASPIENNGNTILPNESLTFNLLENDAIEEDAEIIYVDENTVEGAKLVLNSDGTYTYTPEEDFIGEDSFSYTICSDGIVSEESCFTTIVEIIVEPTNYTLTDDDYDFIIAEYGSISGFEALIDSLEEGNSFDLDDSDDLAWNDDQLEQVLNKVIANNFDDVEANDFFRVLYNVQDEEELSDTVIQFEVEEEVVIVLNPISLTLSDEDIDLIVTEFTGVTGFEEQVANLEEFRNFTRSGQASTWGDFQLLQAISVVLNAKMTPVEENLITVTYDAFDGGSVFTQTKVVYFVDGEYEYFVEDAFIGGQTSLSFNIPTNISGYYSEFIATGSTTNLFGLLNDITVDAHTIDLTYTPGVWDTLMDSDVNPDDSSEILLIYGYNDADDQENSRTRGRESIATNAGGSPGFWNREHVFSRSLGNPNLEFVGPGSDAHHLRPADPNVNSSRSNNKFSDGSGDVSFRTTDGGWYPGDEWIGDVARMMMYMYVRYQGQCLPSAVAIGDTNSIDPNMIDLLLEWNIEDPVSDFELQRNNVIGEAQGNRNPFIDNPYLATLIWGGEMAENTWE